MHAHWHVYYLVRIADREENGANVDKHLHTSWSRPNISVLNTYEWNDETYEDEDEDEDEDDEDEDDENMRRVWCSVTMSTNHDPARQNAYRAKPNRQHQTERNEHKH